MAHYLDLGDIIARRLSEQLRATQPNLAVLSARDLAGVRESEQRLPAVHVLYAGDNIDTAQGRGAMQTVDQGWMVVCAVRDLRGSDTSAADMGELIDDVLQTLLGWHPSATHGHLRRVSAPAPIYRGGVFYVPLLFRSRLLRIGERLHPET
jgi:hypothetical protein